MKPKTLIPIIIVILLVGGTYYYLSNNDPDTPNTPDETDQPQDTENPDDIIDDTIEPQTPPDTETITVLPPDGQGRPPQTVTIEYKDTSYPTATGTTSGTFTTGQNADIMLSGIDFDTTGGATLFNHPAGITSDGTHIILTDTWNNRILIWNTPPTENTPPDIVLGQKNFNTRNPGKDLDQMNWPISASTDGEKLVITDTNNDRILVWNTFPTENGQPADFALTGTITSEPKKQILWPWGVWTNGEKLAVSCTGAAKVLIWSEFPTSDTAADIMLEGLLGTPRHITSNGECLIVGDHNPKTDPPYLLGGTFVYTTFPTEDGETEDYIMDGTEDAGTTRATSY